MQFTTKFQEAQLFGWLRKQSSKMILIISFHFFKRHGGTLFGNLWAGPGGMLEEQDDYDNWKADFPQCYEKY